MDGRYRTEVCAGSEEFAALQVVEREPARGDRDPEGHDPEQQHGRHRHAPVEPGGGEPGGQCRLDRADPARRRDGRADRLPGEVDDADRRDAQVAAERADARDETARS